MIGFLPKLVARIPATIHTKLLVSFLSIVAMFLVLGAVGLGVLHSADRRADHLLSLQRQVDAFQQLHRNTTSVLYTITSAILTTRERDLATAGRKLGQFTYDFQRARFVGEDKAGLLASIKTDYENLVRIGGDVIGLVRNGRREEARKLHIQRAVPLSSRIERNAHTLVNEAEAKMVDAGVAGNRAYVTSQTIVIAVAICSILLGLGLGYAISSSLLTPIRRMDARFNAIAAGKFSEQVSVTNRDELGTLAGNLNVMSEELNRLYRELEAASRHKSEFLATMSHEIRTPMNAVIGMTNLLQDTGLDREQREFADSIHDSAQALLTIINDILDFSKVEAGKLELENEAFELRECIESALDLIANSAAKKGLELAYIIEPNTPESVVGDITRLRQILINLLSNAVKFTEKGEIVVHVAPDSTPDGGGGAARQGYHFAVRDTGIGIAPAALDRLFKSFSQADSSTTRHYGGTGLGLAISKQLAELMDGRIWVESEVGRGTTFHFTVRLATSLAPTRLSEQRDSLDLSGKRLLVVAPDDSTNCQILVDYMRSWQMTPLVAPTPEKAWDLICASAPFDACILDLDAPEIDGLSLAEKITENGYAPGMSLVALGSTGAAVGYDRQGKKVAVFAALLNKPIKPSTCFDTLAAIFADDALYMDGRDTKSAPLFDSSLARQLPLRILLADDHATNRLLGLKMLQRLGYDADVAENGVAVLAALEREDYDVVLMDVQMPEMDGLETTRHIRKRWPKNGPRVIAITANAMQGARAECLAAGMDDYVSKPIQPDHLVAALRRCGTPSAGAALTGAAEPEANYGADDSQEGPAGIEKRESVGLPPIDPGALEALREVVGGNGNMMGELIQSYLDETPKLLQALEAALRDGRPDRLQIAAHTLKSSSADFGAHALAKMGKKLEDMGRADVLKGAAERIALAQVEYERVRSGLTEMLDRYQTGPQPPNMKS